MFYGDLLWVERCITNSKNTKIHVPMLNKVLLQFEKMYEDELFNDEEKYERYWEVNSKLWNLKWRLL